jgi:fucose 4-O-acetylase-like acetyltransferase
MNLNALKGILILLVIVDHNDFSRLLIDGFLYGFGFHVVGFMTIPFLKPAAALDKEFAAYAFRQYYPFFLVATLMAILVTFVRHAGPAGQLHAWAIAVYSGNAAALKRATDMSLLWFLPSFISLVALRTLIENMGKVGKPLAIGVLCVAHLFIGAVAHAVQDDVPLGLLPALYMIPLAWLGVWLHRTVFERLRAAGALMLAIAVFVPVKYLQMRGHLYNEVGFAEVADYTRPAALLLNDLECVTGVLMLFQLCRLPLGRLIEQFGRYSIQVYLFHAFIALAVYRAVLLVPASAAVHFAVSFCVTAFLSLLLARWLAHNPLAQRFIFPRGPAALFGPGLKRHGRLRAATVPLASSQPDLNR